MVAKADELTVRAVAVIRQKLPKDSPGFFT